MLSLFSSLLLAPQADVPPPLPREFRAAWVATVDNIDWPSRPGLSEARQRQEMVRILDTLEELNMNAVVFQIRPTADSLYRSKIEPWSWFLSGEQGKGPSYDPLEFTIEEAHKRGIEVHVWFNPYRAWHFKQQGPRVASHVTRTHPQYVYRYGNFEWMDPGVKWVQDRSYAVFMDVVERYDIDAIHIDDYFYPYPVANTPFPDEPTFQAYRRRGGTLSKSDWRRQNVNDFIKRIYDSVQRRKPWVRFGISPFGIYRPGVPAGIAAGVDQFEDLAADALKWWDRGWCDYMAPQLYWAIEQKPQAFPVLLEWWKSTNRQRRHLWPGLFTSRLENTYDADQVVRQTRMTQVEGVGGQIHFSMRALLNDWKGIRKALKEGPYSERVVPPATPWRDRRAPSRPQVRLSGESVTINPGSDRDLRFISLQARVNGTWRLVDLRRAERVTLPTSEFPAGTDRVAVRVLDRVQNSSDPAIVAVR